MLGSVCLFCKSTRVYTLMMSHTQRLYLVLVPSASFLTSCFADSENFAHHVLCCSSSRSLLMRIWDSAFGSVQSNFIIPIQPYTIQSIPFHSRPLQPLYHITPHNITTPSFPFSSNTPILSQFNFNLAYVTHPPLHQPIPSIA